MTVNGGLSSNNSIFFSEIQSAFGGSNPIFINEYYRGGEVPVNRTVTSYAAMSNSGSGAGTARGIEVAQTSVAGGTVAAGNNDLSTTSSERSLGQASAGGVPSGSFMGGVDGGAVRADAWYVRFSTVRNPADWEITGATVRNNRTGQTAGIPGNGGSIYFQGPVWLNNDGSEPSVGGRLIPSQPSAFPGGIQAGDTFSVTGCSGFRCGISPVTSGQRTRSTTTRAATFNTTMTNRSGFTLNFTSSVGNDSSFTNGESVSAAGQTSSSWNWSHPAVTATSSDANSSVPSSGTLDMNDFRSITNYTPG